MSDVPVDDLPDNLVPASDLPGAGGRYVVEPNSLQRRAGIRRARFKDENLAGNVGSGFLTLGEDVGRETQNALIAGGAPHNLALLGGLAADAGTMLVPVGPSGKAAAAAAAPVLDKGAKRVMQAALKPTSKSLVNGDAAKAIDTMLREGVNATAGGAAKLRISINKLKSEVADLIANSPANVSLAPAYRELQGTLDDVGKKGIGYEADQAAVLKAWDEFKAHPLFKGGDTVPVQVADTVKRATQQSVDYTVPAANRSAADRAKMAAASGLRQGMEQAEPGVAPINAKLSEYINALHQIEPRAAVQANSEVFGLAPIAGSAEGAMLALAQRNPWLKSYVAQVLYGGKLPSAVARTGVVGANAMSREE